MDSAVRMAGGRPERSEYQSNPRMSRAHSSRRCCQTRRASHSKPRRRRNGCVWAHVSLTGCDTFGLPSRQPDIRPIVCDPEDERTLGRNWLPLLQNWCLFWAQEHENLPHSIAVRPYATLKLNIDDTRNLIVAGERRDGNKIDVALRAPIKKVMGWQWTGNNWQIVLSVRLPVSPC